jgi:hypothetical protein
MEVLMSSTKSHRSTIYLTAAVPGWLKTEVIRYCEENDLTVSHIIRRELAKLVSAGRAANA